MDDYYDSPITLYRAVTTKFEEDAVNKIIRAVSEYELDIDKEKLIAALKHDKERYMDAYKKGYADGYKSARNETMTIPKEED